jgi:hypothetical protein
MLASECRKFMYNFVRNLPVSYLRRRIIFAYRGRTGIPCIMQTIEITPTTVQAKLAQLNLFPSRSSCSEILQLTETRLKSISRTTASENSSLDKLIEMKAVISVYKLQLERNNVCVCLFSVQINKHPCFVLLFCICIYNTLVIYLGRNEKRYRYGVMNALRNMYRKSRIIHQHSILFTSLFVNLTRTHNSLFS